MEKNVSLKKLGGLGLRRTMPLNHAFIAKLGWKILSDPNNLWVRKIREKYLTDSTFFGNNSKSKYSFIWKKILSQRELLRKDIRWMDKWASYCSLIEILDTNPSQVNINDKVSDFILPKGKRDLEKLKTILQDNLAKMTIGIPLLHSQ